MFQHERYRQGLLLSPNSVKVLDLGKIYKNPSIPEYGSPHLLLALLEGEKRGLSAPIFEKLGFSAEGLQNKIIYLIGNHVIYERMNVPGILELAKEEAGFSGDGRIRPVHLLIALMRNPLKEMYSARNLLINCGIDEKHIDKIRTLAKQLGDQNLPEKPKD